MRQKKTILRIEIGETVIQRRFASDSYIDTFNLLYDKHIIDESILRQCGFIRNSRTEFSQEQGKNAFLINGSKTLWLTTHSSSIMKKAQIEEVFSKYKIDGKVNIISNLRTGSLVESDQESDENDIDDPREGDRFLEPIDSDQENAEDGEVEDEEVDTSLKLMDKPFDPTKINIETKTPSLDTLINRIKRNNVQLNTESYFQRKDDLWDTVKQSRLIESILIRFPLPAFFFDATDDNNWLIVDGLQRLSSIRNFVVTKTLKLTNLEFLDLNDLGWDDLSSDLQRIIEESQIVIYKIMPGTPTDVKFNIFKRINTGGLILSPQEIRHALFQGKPANFIYELARSKEFLDATSYKIKTHRMLDRDFANRFLCFYLFGYNNYTPDLDTFMSKAMASINDKTDDELDKIRWDFAGAMDLSIAIFGNEAFRKIFTHSRRRPPINKALFDAISVQFGLLSNIERTILKANDQQFRQGLEELMATDSYFLTSVTSSTGDKNRVIHRHRCIEELIRKII